MSEVLLVKRPQVAEPPRPLPIAAVGGALLLVGAGVFFWLSEARATQQDRQSSLPALVATADNAPPAPAPAVPVANASATAPPSAGIFIPNSGPVTLVESKPRTSYSMSPIASPTPLADPLRERSQAPTLVIDLAQTEVPRPPGTQEVRSDAGGTQVAPAPAPPIATARDPSLSATERFAARVGGEEVEVATAHQMTKLDTLIPQGAVIGGVMETALNSDLPGFARAIVQRDVRSFDGSTVLIPAGSRMIGQYKSGIAQGASRVFVLWTRLIRPDGVSIELASPAVDDLGRAGIGGKVNRHFLQRFGGAVLTSVLSAGINAAAASASSGSTILVGSSGQAANLANLASQNADIPPTITTKQGAAVRIFVARDLDFSRVGPVR